MNYTEIKTDDDRCNWLLLQAENSRNIRLSSVAVEQAHIGSDYESGLDHRIESLIPARNPESIKRSKALRNLSTLSPLIDSVAPINDSGWKRSEKDRATKYSYSTLSEFLRTIKAKNIGVGSSYLVRAINITLSEFYKYESASNQNNMLYLTECFLYVMKLDRSRKIPADKRFSAEGFSKMQLATINDVKRFYNLIIGLQFHNIIGKACIIGIEGKAAFSIAQILQRYGIVSDRASDVSDLINKLYNDDNLNQPVDVIISGSSYPLSPGRKNDPAIVEKLVKILKTNGYDGSIVMAAGEKPLDLTGIDCFVCVEKSDSRYCPAICRDVIGLIRRKINES